MPQQIHLPGPVHTAIDLLNRAHFEAWAVGGAVRDSLLLLSPHDWDIATNATPEEILAVFSRFRCIPTGMRHGTVTVIIQGQALEITTYRVDQAYPDHRHPSAVVFTHSLKEDLARRDFTINAMAYHPALGLFDPFGGREDLQNKCIRCVGDPFARLEEDALRILRALRFSAQLGFGIHTQTRLALLNKAQGLFYISFERAWAEISRLLSASFIAGATLPFQSVLAAWWVNLGRYSPQQWEKTVLAMQSLPAQIPLRLAALCFGLWDHTEEGQTRLLNELHTRCVPRQTRKELQMLLAGAKTGLWDTLPQIKRLLRQYGPDLANSILLLRAALFPDEAPKLAKAHSMITEILQSRACWQTSQLDICAQDLLALGLKGRQIGQALAFLCDAVIDEKCPNQRTALLAYLQHFPPLPPLA